MFIVCHIHVECGGDPRHKQLCEQCDKTSLTCHIRLLICIRKRIIKKPIFYKSFESVLSSAKSALQAVVS